MIFIPRIGQEVIVDFLEGDPDQPLITGSVYNAEQMPPYALPDNKTQSGAQDAAARRAADRDFNELRFEDKKGSRGDLLPRREGLQPRRREQRHAQGRQQQPRADEIKNNRTETVKTATRR